MAKAKLHAADGSLKSEVELPAALFDAEVSKACIYLAVNAFLANQRQGTSKSKTRSEIQGSGAKPWKQKGTGRARSGTNSSPIWVRGNKAHGPEPRYYFKKVNKKVKRKALLSALSAKAQDQAIRVFESLKLDTPKTSALVKTLSNAEMEARNALLVVSQDDTYIQQAAANIPWVRVIRVEDLNTYSLIRARQIVFSQSAVDFMAGGEK